MAFGAKRLVLSGRTGAGHSPMMDGGVGAMDQYAKWFVQGLLLGLLGLPGLFALGVILCNVGY